MANKPMAAERLREFVRARVRPGEALFKRGTNARLAKHLKDFGCSEDAAWISAYADPDADPKRNASLDVALAICEFFQVDVRQFADFGPKLTREGSTTRPIGGHSDVVASAPRAHLRKIADLQSRLKQYEITLAKVQTGARAIEKLATIRKQSRQAVRRRA